MSSNVCLDADRLVSSPLRFAAFLRRLPSLVNNVTLQPDRPADLIAPSVGTSAEVPEARLHPSSSISATVAASVCRAVLHRLCVSTVAACRCAAAKDARGREVTSLCVKAYKKIRQKFMDATQPQTSTSGPTSQDTVTAAPSSSNGVDELLDVLLHLFKHLLPYAQSGACVHEMLKLVERDVEKSIKSVETQSAITSANVASSSTPHSTHRSSPHSSSSPCASSTSPSSIGPTASSTPVAASSLWPYALCGLLVDCCVSTPRLPYVLFDGDEEGGMKIEANINKRSSCMMPNTGCSYATWLYMEPVLDAQALDSLYSSQPHIAHSSPSSDSPPLGSHSQHPSNPTFHLLHLSNDDGHMQLHLTYDASTGALTVRIGVTDDLTPSSADSSYSHEFSDVCLIPHRWSHIVLTHDKATTEMSKSNRTAHGAQSVVRLYVDGMCMGETTMPYPSCLFSDGKPFNGWIGSHAPDESRSASSGTVSGQRWRWRMTSTMLISTCLDDESIRKLTDAGPRLAQYISSSSSSTSSADLGSVTDVMAGCYALPTGCAESLDAIAASIIRQRKHAHFATIGTESGNGTGNGNGTISTSQTPPQLCLSPHEHLLAPAVSSEHDLLTGKDTTPLEQDSTPLHAVVPMEDIVWCVHARYAERRVAWDMERTTNDTNEAAQDPHTWLFNGGHPSYSSTATLHGHACAVIHPRTFPDLLRSVGGIKRLLLLVDRCATLATRTSISTSSIPADAQPSPSSSISAAAHHLSPAFNLTHNPSTAMRQCLMLLLMCLRRQPYLFRELHSSNGYRLLAQIMKNVASCRFHVKQAELAQRTTPRSFTPNNAATNATTPASTRLPSSSQSTLRTYPLIDVHLVDLLLALVGLSDRGMSGYIANQLALQQLLLHEELFIRMSSISAKHHLLQALINACVGNGERRTNLQALRQAGCVHWCLIMMEKEGRDDGGEQPQRRRVSATPLPAHLARRPSASHQHSSPSLLSHLLTLLRLLLMDRVVEEEVQEVANFALTCTLDPTGHDAVEQQPSCTANESGVEKGKMPSSSHTCTPLTPLSPPQTSTNHAKLSRRQKRSLYAARSLQEACVEMLLDVMTKLSTFSTPSSLGSTSSSPSDMSNGEISSPAFMSPASSTSLSTGSQSSTSQSTPSLPSSSPSPPCSSPDVGYPQAPMQIFSRCVSFHWIFSMLKSHPSSPPMGVDSQIETNGAATKEAGRPTSTCAVLLLKMLLILLSQQEQLALFRRSSNTQQKQQVGPPSHHEPMIQRGVSFASLSNLLLPYASCPRLYPPLFALLLGRDIHSLSNTPPELSMETVEVLFHALVRRPSNNEETTTVRLVVPEVVDILVDLLARNLHTLRQQQQQHMTDYPASFFSATAAALSMPSAMHVQSSPKHGSLVSSSSPRNSNPYATVFDTDLLDHTHPRAHAFYKSLTSSNSCSKALRTQQYTIMQSIGVNLGEGVNDEREDSLPLPPREPLTRLLADLIPTEKGSNAKEQRPHPLSTFTPHGDVSVGTPQSDRTHRAAFTFSPHSRRHAERIPNFCQSAPSESLLNGLMLFLMNLLQHSDDFVRIANRSTFLRPFVSALFAAAQLNPLLLSGHHDPSKQDINSPCSKTGDGRTTPERKMQNTSRMSPLPPLPTHGRPHSTTPTRGHSKEDTNRFTSNANMMSSPRTTITGLDLRTPHNAFLHSPPNAPSPLSPQYMRYQQQQLSILVAPPSPIAARIQPTTSSPSRSGTSTVPFTLSIDTPTTPDMAALQSLVTAQLSNASGAGRSFFDRTPTPPHQSLHSDAHSDESSKSFTFASSRGTSEASSLPSSILSSPMLSTGCTSMLSTGCISSPSFSIAQYPASVLLPPSSPASAPLIRLPIFRLSTCQLMLRFLRQLMERTMRAKKDGWIIIEKVLDAFPVVGHSIDNNDDMHEPRERGEDATTNAINNYRKQENLIKAYQSTLLTILLSRFQERLRAPSNDLPLLAPSTSSASSNNSIPLPSNYLLNVSRATEFILLKIQSGTFLTQQWTISQLNNDDGLGMMGTAQNVSNARSPHRAGAATPTSTPTDVAHDISGNGSSINSCVGLLLFVTQLLNHPTLLPHVADLSKSTAAMLSKHAAGSRRRSAQAPGGRDDTSANNISGRATVLPSSLTDALVQHPLQRCIRTLIDVQINCLLHLYDRLSMKWLDAASIIDVNKFVLRHLHTLLSDYAIHGWVSNYISTNNDLAGAAIQLSDPSGMSSSIPSHYNGRSFISCLLYHLYFFQLTFTSPASSLEEMGRSDPNTTAGREAKSSSSPSRRHVSKSTVEDVRLGALSILIHLVRTKPALMAELMRATIAAGSASEQDKLGPAHTVSYDLFNKGFDVLQHGFHFLSGPDHSAPSPSLAISSSPHHHARAELEGFFDWLSIQQPILHIVFTRALKTEWKKYCTFNNSFLQTAHATTMKKVVKAAKRDKQNIEMDHTENETLHGLLSQVLTECSRVERDRARYRRYLAATHERDLAQALERELRRPMRRWRHMFSTSKKVHPTTTVTVQPQSLSLPMTAEPCSSNSSNDSLDEESSRLRFVQRWCVDDIECISRQHARLAPASLIDPDTQQLFTYPYKRHADDVRETQRLHNIFRKHSRSGTSHTRHHGEAEESGDQRCATEPLDESRTSVAMLTRPSSACTSEKADVDRCPTATSTTPLAAKSVAANPMALAEPESAPTECGVSDANEHTIHSRIMLRNMSPLDPTVAEKDGITVGKRDLTVGDSFGNSDAISALTPTAGKIVPESSERPVRHHHRSSTFLLTVPFNNAPSPTAMRSPTKPNTSILSPSKPGHPPFHPPSPMRAIPFHDAATPRNALGTIPHMPHLSPTRLQVNRRSPTAMKHAFRMPSPRSANSIPELPSQPNRRRSVSFDDTETPSPFPSTHLDDNGSTPLLSPSDPVSANLLSPSTSIMHSQSHSSSIPSPSPSSTCTHDNETGNSSLHPLRTGSTTPTSKADPIILTSPTLLDADKPTVRETKGAVSVKADELSNDMGADDTEPPMEDASIPCEPEPQPARATRSMSHPPKATSGDAGPDNERPSRSASCPTSTTDSNSTLADEEQQSDKSPVADDDNDDAWLHEVRLHCMIGDETINYHYNCLRIVGLEEVSAVMLLCTHSVFICDGYQIDAGGNIVRLKEEDAEEIKETSDTKRLPSPVLFRRGSDDGDDVGYKRWSYNDVISAHKRRYLLRPAALELFFIDHTSCMLVVNIKQRDIIYNHLLQLCPNCAMGPNLQFMALSDGLASISSSVSKVGGSSGNGRKTATTEASSADEHDDGTRRDKTKHVQSGSANQRTSSARIGRFTSNLSSYFFASQHTLSTEYDALLLTASLSNLMSSLTLEWQHGLLSNYDYLILLNSLSGRSFNDPSQYPVFPWVLSQYHSRGLELDQIETFRDLSKPVGALDPDRARFHQHKYRETEHLWKEEMRDGHVHGTASIVPPDISRAYHYSTHYSSAAIVMHYLVRVAPFTEYLIHFQSGRFDRAERLFQSLQQTWITATRLLNGDVKEAIPELYFFAPLLRNGNGLELGQRQDGRPVNDVLLAPWSKGSAREFMRLHRLALESDYVSAHLHEWIDLIWGMKQRGPEAIDACNVFHYLTYAGNVSIDSIQDPLLRRATVEQIRSFGQCPLQLFTKVHPPKIRAASRPRLWLEASSAQPTDMARFPHGIGQIFCVESSTMLGGAGSANMYASMATNGIERIIVTKQHHAIALPSLTPPSSFLPYSFVHSPCATSIRNPRSAKSYRSSPAFNKLSCISWSYVDGSVRTAMLDMSGNGNSATTGRSAAGISDATSTPSNSGPSKSSTHHSRTTSGLMRASSASSDSWPLRLSRSYLNMHRGRVRVAAMPLEGDDGTLVTGGDDCLVCVWRKPSFGLAHAQSNPLAADYVLVGELHGHRAPVTCLAVSAAFSLIASGSDDSTVILWDLHRMTSVRQLRFAPLGSSISCIHFNTLTGDLCFASSHPASLFFTDVNGTLLAKFPDPRMKEAATRADEEKISTQLGGLASASLLLEQRLDEVTSLCVAPTIGYHSSSSEARVDCSALIITGHRSGLVCIWRLQFLSFSELFTLMEELHVGVRSPPTRSAEPCVTDRSRPSPTDDQEWSGSECESAPPIVTMSAAGESSAPLPPPIAGRCVSDMSASMESNASEMGARDAHEVAATCESVPVGVTNDAVDIPEAQLTAPDRAECQADNATTIPSTPPALRLVTSGPDTMSLADLESDVLLDSPARLAAAQQHQAHALAISTHMFGSPGEEQIADDYFLNKQQEEARRKSQNHEQSNPGMTASPPSIVSPPPVHRQWHLIRVAELVGHQVAVTALCLSRDGHSFFSGDTNGNVIHFTLPQLTHAPSSSHSHRHQPHARHHDATAAGSKPICSCAASRNKSRIKILQTLLTGVSVAGQSIPVTRMTCNQSGCLFVGCDLCLLDHLRDAHPYPQAVPEPAPVKAASDPFIEQ